MVALQCTVKLKRGIMYLLSKEKLTDMKSLLVKSKKDLRRIFSVINICFIVGKITKKYYLILVLSLLIPWNKFTVKLLATMSMNPSTFMHDYVD